MLKIPGPKTRKTNGKKADEASGTERCIMTPDST